jgi:hypothetical protein
MPPKKAKKVDAASNYKIDALAKRLLELKRYKTAIEAKHQQELQPVTALEEEINGRLMVWMKANGTQSIRTAEGTITLKRRDTASCIADPDGFMSFVIEKELFELLERRANTTACKEFAEEHGGKLPPGVKISTREYLAITEPK